MIAYKEGIHSHCLQGHSTIPNPRGPVWSVPPVLVQQGLLDLTRVISAGKDHGPGFSCGQTSLLAFVSSSYDLFNP